MADTEPPTTPPAPPPLPPRREVSPSPTSANKAPASASWWTRTKSGTATLWDSAYKTADKVGYWSNAKAGKLGVEAFYPTSLDIESTKCARILRTFTVDAADLPDEVSLADRRKSQVVLRKIPPAAIASAQGLAIFTVFRSGFVVSGASGSGVVLSRLKDGTWSAPSGILLHTIGFGFSAGIDVYDVVLILRNEKAVNSFKRPRISLGGEISIAAGPVGNGFQIETAHTLSPVWSYTKSKGLYGGVQLDGTVLIERNAENARSYGRKVKAAEVLEGEVAVPEFCTGLHQTILAAEGFDYRPDLIPQGPSVSEIAPSPDLAALSAAQHEDGSSSPSTASPPASPPAASTSPNVSFLSSFSRSASSTFSRSRASSSATSMTSSSMPTAATAIRKLPKEELDDEDLAARKELEAALRSFGIEDPEVNSKSRAEDPLLIVEEKDEAAPAEKEVDTAAGILTDAVEHPPAASADVSRRGSVKGAGEKPPVPPRRTPRIGTASSSAAPSPVVAQAEDKEGEEKKDDAEKEQEDGEDEAKEPTTPGAATETETEASESFEDASEGGAATADEGDEGEETKGGEEGTPKKGKKRGGKKQ
ncbi:hypothetical protein JCM8097_001271 [Rhodosporidiobolus ruineniae]